MIVIDDNFLNDIQKKYLDNIFTSFTHNFQFVRDGTKEPDGNNHFEHVVLDDNGFTDSELKYGLVDIFNCFCKKNNIEHKGLFRCAVNLTYNLGNIYRTPSHLDHTFDHKYFLLYLNDSTGDTVIMDESNEKPLKIISPKKYRGVCWGRNHHYFYFPTQGGRKVVIYTYI